MPIKLFPSLSKSKFFLVLVLFKKNSFWAHFVTFQGPLLSVVQKKIGNFFLRTPHTIYYQKNTVKIIPQGGGEVDLK